MKTVAILLLALVAASYAARLDLDVLPEKLEEHHYEGLFQQFRNVFNKMYDTVDEFEYRFKIFRANVDFVREYNRKSDDARVTINHMSDLSADEFRARYLGKYEGVAAPEVHQNSGLALPKSVDWRTKGVVTPVKNQEQCGSCWAFSTTGSTEGAYAIKTGNLVSLSEQNLVDCVTKSDGCNGGLMQFGFEYIINNNGIDTESSYPYTAQDGTCRFNKDNVGATIQSYVNVTSGDENALADAVANNGPISVAIDANHPEFMQYQNGVITIPSCSSTQLDHGVLVVGYGKTMLGKQYWIVKNSWSTEWGQEGYVWMRKDHNNMCGIATAASYPKA